MSIAIRTDKIIVSGLFSENWTKSSNYGSEIPKLKLHLL